MSRSSGVFYHCAVVSQTQRQLSQNLSSHLQTQHLSSPVSRLLTWKDTTIRRSAADTMLGPSMKMHLDGGVLTGNCCVNVRKNIKSKVPFCNSLFVNITAMAWLQLSYNNSKEEALIFYYFMQNAEQQTARTRAAPHHLHPDTVQYI